MSTKILTFRIPVSVYSSLCISAAELGVSVSAHVRRLVEQEHQAEQIREIRRELINRLDQLILAHGKTTGAFQNFEEILMLSRATASHLNPQLVTFVRAQLANQK